MEILNNIIEDIFINEFLNKDIILNEDIKNYELKIIVNSLYFIIEFNNLDNIYYDLKKIDELLIYYVNEKFYNISLNNYNKDEIIKLIENNNKLKIIFSYKRKIKLY